MCQVYSILLIHDPST